MNARALIENIENYTTSGRINYIDPDSSSNPSSFRSPLQLRRRTFDSNFYFDEHTKRRTSATKNNGIRFSPSDQQRSTGSNKRGVRHITPTKVFQGVIFNVPEIRDDTPWVDASVHVGNESPHCDSPVHLNEIESELRVEKFETELHTKSQHSNDHSQNHVVKVDSTQNHTVKVDASMMDGNHQPSSANLKEHNATYWTTVAVKVAQSIVMNGGKLQHAEEAQMIILDCAKDKSLSLRQDGATVIASKISSTLLQLGASEYVVTKAVTMFLRCVSTPDVSAIRELLDSPLNARVKQEDRSSAGTRLMDAGCEVGYAFLLTVAETIMSSCAYVQTSDFSNSSVHETASNETSYDSSTLKYSGDEDTIRRKRFGKLRS